MKDKRTYEVARPISSKTEREVAYKDATDRIERAPAPSPSVRACIKTYGYARLARDIGVTTQAIHKWFKLSRVPSKHKDEVASRIGVDRHLLDRCF